MSTTGSSLYFESSLFDSFDHQSSATQEQSRSALVLGESVFDKFAHAPTMKQEFDFDAALPLAPTTVDASELASPAMVGGTISPMEIHSSLIESVFDTPELDGSPMFEELEGEDQSSWVSLFSESDLTMQVATTTTTTAEQAPEPSPKKRSFEAASPSLSPLLEQEEEEEVEQQTKRVKHSPSTDHLGVVSYNRKQRSAPLSPITTDESDPVAAKRARNTEAARRSRARKMERMSQLEDKVEALLQKNSDLEDEVHRLRALLGQSV